MTAKPADNRMPLTQLLEKRDVLKVIVTALAQTIAGYTRCEVKTKSPFLKESSSPSDIGIAGMIRFEGSPFSVELFLGISKELFLNLYENMFNMTVAEISGDNQDLAAEILNISFGIMDPQFKCLGLNLRSSFPKIYSGKKLQDLLKTIESRAISIPFESQGRSFFVEIYSADSLKEDWKYDPKSSQKVA